MTSTMNVLLILIFAVTQALDMNQSLPINLYAQPGLNLFHQQPGLIRSSPPNPSGLAINKPDVDRAICSRKTMRENVYVLSKIDNFDRRHLQNRYIRLHGSIEEKIDFKKCPRSYQEVQLDERTLDKVNKELMKAKKSKLALPPSAGDQTPAYQDSDNSALLTKKAILQQCGLPSKYKGDPRHTGCVWAYLTVPSKYHQYGIRGSVQEYLKDCLVYYDPAEKPEFRIIHESLKGNYFAAYMSEDSRDATGQDIHPFQRNPMLQYGDDDDDDAQKRDRRNPRAAINQLVMNTIGKFLYKSDFKKNSDLCKFENGEEYDAEGSQSALAFQPRVPKMGGGQVGKFGQAVNNLGGALSGKLNNLKSQKDGKKKGVVATLCYDTHYLAERRFGMRKDSLLPLECQSLTAKDLPKAYFDSRKTISTDDLKNHFVKKLCAGGKSTFKAAYCPGKGNHNVELDHWVLSDDQRDGLKNAPGIEKCPVPRFLDEEFTRDNDVAGQDGGDTWRLTLFQPESTLVFFHVTDYNLQVVDTFLPVGSMVQTVQVLAHHILTDRGSPIQGLPMNNQAGWVQNALEAPFLFGLTALKEYKPVAKAWDHRQHGSLQGWSSAQSAYLGNFKGMMKTIEFDYVARDEVVPGLYLGAVGKPQNLAGNSNLPFETFSKPLLAPQMQFVNGQLNMQYIQSLRRSFLDDAKRLGVCVPPVQDQSLPMQQNNGFVQQQQMFQQVQQQPVNAFNNDFGWGF